MIEHRIIINAYLFSSAIRGGTMQEDQLKLLETRISKAIIFIENLKTREKGLLREKERLNQKIDTLEKTIEEKEERIKELKGAQEFLKEKIETILGKLESFASIESESESKNQVIFGQGKDVKGMQSEETIIEEEPVDMQKEGDEGGSILLNTEDSVVDMDDIENPSEEGKEVEKDEENVPDEIDEDQETLFSTDLDEGKDAGVDGESIIKQYETSHENTVDEQDPQLKWFGNNPFIDT